MLPNESRIALCCEKGYANAPAQFKITQDVVQETTAFVQQFMRICHN